MIGQATPVLEFHYLQTTVVPFLKCVWGCCLAEKSSPPLFPMFQSFPPPPSSNISQYWSAFNLYKLPHTISPHKTPYHAPPCLTVGVIVWSDINSPHCFQTYTFPSDPILLIFVSSNHNTLFQSSTVQFSWYCANLSCF